MKQILDFRILDASLVYVWIVNNLLSPSCKCVGFNLLIYSIRSSRRDLCLMSSGVISDVACICYSVCFLRSGNLYWKSKTSISIRINFILENHASKTWMTHLSRIWNLWHRAIKQYVLILMDLFFNCHFESLFWNFVFLLHNFLKVSKMT